MIQKAILFVIILNWVSGCNLLTRPNLVHHAVPPTVKQTAGDDIDIDTALKLANDILTMDASEQLKVCRRVENENANQQQIASRLRVAISMSLIADCGSQAQAVEILNEVVINAEKEPVKHFLSVFTALVERNIIATQYERKLRNRLVSFTNKTTWLRKNLKSTQIELELLQSKLEELKLIEQTINTR